MFTGIIEALGAVAGTERRGGDVRLLIRAAGLELGAARLGDSIAVNGVCLTVVELQGDSFAADVSVETLDHTTAEQWVVGTPVNLEQALTPDKRMGGHIVSGHVDGVGEVIARHSDARSERFRLRAPAGLARYIAHKGSITIDGTSLTVNVVDGEEFEINIVPHTLTHTIIGDYQPGTRVNLEVDVIARYLERLLWGAGDGGAGALPNDRLNRG
ncbi:MAG: riboflavin synthase [Porticoccaceae bacterium]